MGRSHLDTRNAPDKVDMEFHSERLILKGVKSSRKIGGHSVLRELYCR
jgi:hypothetical protein